MTPAERYFPYGATEVAYLTAKDPVLGAAIKHIGPIRRPVNTDLFTALVNAVIAQQISAKAHHTIWLRLQALLNNDITPAALLACAPTQIQQLGLTMKKAVYVRELAARVVAGELDLHALPQLSDEEVSRRLCALPGIGPWTAEMLLIFALLRPNVISCGDLAILRGLRMLYRHRRITPALFAKYRRRYAPYASTASLYLWAVAADALPGLSDPGGKSHK